MFNAPFAPVPPNLAGAPDTAAVVWLVPSGNMNPPDIDLMEPVAVIVPATLKVLVGVAVPIPTLPLMTNRP
jgi:hypothetical protein